MLLRVQFREEQKYVKLSELTFDAFLKEEESSASVSKSPKVGGPGRVHQPSTFDREPSDEDVEAAIAVLRHSADEKTVRDKMKMTFIYRQAMVSDEAKSSDVFLVFPRFLDTPGLIEQDFRFLFGEATANKFLEKWPTTFKAKISSSDFKRQQVLVKVH
ncbi:hypothetical protein HF521_015280 [Silurus meridionalis]|uniref:Uncharacterized protein n=1 Tax=Silurus meridionalis TaxID=175797 RepID=A0A8T0A7I5_SILME|nr:hypothetical protein HF521_015280 [Silurus meridionalis]